MQSHDDKDQHSLDIQILESTLDSDQVTLPSLPSLTELQSTFLYNQEEEAPDARPSEALGEIIRQLSKKYGVTSDDDATLDEAENQSEVSGVSYMTSTTDALLLSDPQHGPGGILSTRPPEPDDGEETSGAQPMQKLLTGGATTQSISSQQSQRIPMEPAGEVSVSGVETPSASLFYEGNLGQDIGVASANDRMNDGPPTRLVLASPQSFRQKRQDPDAATPIHKSSETANATFAKAIPVEAAIYDSEVSTQPPTPSPTSEKYGSVSFRDETERSSSFYTKGGGSGYYMKRSVGGSNKDPQLVTEFPTRKRWSAKYVTLVLASVIAGLGGAAATIYFLALKSDGGKDGNSPAQNIELSAPAVGEAPTQAPSTVAPTALARSATQLPSKMPSTTPSFWPSFRPSSSPSASPSLRPSATPSNNPSDRPSISPSFTPTTVPSLTPSLGPSLSPSEGPTGSPTSLESTLMGIVTDVSPQSASLISSPNSPQNLAFAWLMENTRFDQHPKTRIIQRYVLAVLYYSTGGPTSWTENSGWLDYDDECFWYNLRYPPCTGSRVLLFLDLSDNGLLGSLPFELGLLTNLRQLKLSENRGLGGPIPEEVWDLQQLETLELDSTGLNSPLPPQVGNMTSLIRLNLAGSPIPGPAPQELGNLANLDALLLAGTFMTGDMPNGVCDSDPPLSEVSWNCPGCDCCTFCCYLVIGICVAV